MKNKKTSVKSLNSVYLDSILDSNISESTRQSSKLTQQLINHYKSKFQKLEEEYDKLLEVVDDVKRACDLSNDLQRELSLRDEEVSKLQQIVSDLQVYLFREKEKNIKLNAENDQLKIKDFESKKKINALLMLNGGSDKKLLHIITANSQEKFAPSKLPPKLQKLKEEKQKQMMRHLDSNKETESEKENNLDPQVLILYNQSLASELEHHINISREQIDVLLKEKEIAKEERKLERQRLQKEIEFLSSKLKQTQDLLCETTGKLVKLQQICEKEKTSWIEEKDKYVRMINMLKEKTGEDIPDVLGYCVSGVGTSKIRTCGESDFSRDQNLEKEQTTALYQQQILALEAEVNRLRERAQLCKKTFKEKTEKMTAQVTYLRNKYEDLDRRRQLEAEGFRTDIRMLRERVKELEKKLTKANSSLQPSEQQLLISARNTLNRAKQLEKELVYMKSKISALESNEEQSGS